MFLSFCVNNVYKFIVYRVIHWWLITVTLVVAFGFGGKTMGGGR